MSIAWAILALLAFADTMFRAFEVLPGDHSTVFNTGLLCLILMKMGNAK